MSDDQFLQGTWTKLSEVAVKGAQYNSRERLPHPKCLQGTRVDLLKYIHGFLDDTENNQLIWLHGTAGVGKSAVAFTVAERMRGLKVTEETTVEKRLAGTFFFSRKHTKRCTIEYFFATLVYQLATNFPSIQKYVSKIIRDNPALLDPDTSICDQMEALFLRPLRKLQPRLHGCRPLSFVIDALDECTSEPELTELILSLARALREPDLPVTHILLTSRSESHISKVFQDDEVRPLVREIPVRTSGEGGIISLDGADVANDICTFLRHSFKELECRHPDFPQPSKDDLAKLASRAGRRFIVASTMMKFIIDDEDSDPYDRLQLMLKLTSELLPGTEVYKLYDCILSTCADPKRAYMHLSIVAALADPLPISQISTLLGPGLGRDVQKTLIQLRSFVDIPIDTSLSVNIHHSSIRDYVSDSSNCSLPQVRKHNMPSPHSQLADSSLRLMMKEIPEGTALLDALSELKNHSQAMEPQDTQRLKDSLSFLVQPPEPLSILIRILWLRGDRGPDLLYWIESLDGHAWLQTQEGKEWLQIESGKSWLQTQGGRDWVQTRGGQYWLQTRGGKDWLMAKKYRDWTQRENFLPTQYHWDVTPSITYYSTGFEPMLLPDYLQCGFQTSCFQQDQLRCPIYRTINDASEKKKKKKKKKKKQKSPQILRGQDWLQTPRGRVWLKTPCGRTWLKTQREGERLQTPRGQIWLLTRIGQDWLQTRSGKDWLQALGERDWLSTPRGQAWLQTSRGQDWLQTQRGKDWMQTKGREDWMQTQHGQDWLQTQRGQDWLQTQRGQDWLQTQRGQDWLQAQRGQDWLQTQPGQDWLQTQPGRHWLQTQPGQDWLQSKHGRGWLQTQRGKDWLQTKGGEDWLHTKRGEDWLQTQRGHDWLHTTGGEDWLETQHGRDWLYTMRREDWLQTQPGKVWLHTQRGRHWLQTQPRQDWLQNKRGRGWLQTQRGQDWVQTKGGQDWLHTKVGKDWLQTQRGHDWLHTTGGEDWLETQHGRDWLYTMRGEDWLHSKGGDWLQTQPRQYWLQTKRGQDWLQTQPGKDWLQTQRGQDRLQTQPRQDWLQTKRGQDWLQTQPGKYWLQTQRGQDWLQTRRVEHWLHTKGGDDWLQTRRGRGWLRTQRGRDWLRTQPGKDWLQTQPGQDWLQTQGGRDWLQTQPGQDWLQTQRGRDWLHTKGGKYWLQTQHGQNWLQTQHGRDWPQTHGGLDTEPGHKLLAADPGRARLVTDSAWTRVVADPTRTRVVANTPWTSMAVHSCCVCLGDDERILEHTASYERVCHCPRIAVTPSFPSSPAVQGLARFLDVSNVPGIIAPGLFHLYITRNKFLV